LTWLVAVGVGLAQIVAGVFPGTSRAGATIMMAPGVGTEPARGHGVFLPRRHPHAAGGPEPRKLTTRSSTPAGASRVGNGGAGHGRLAASAFLVVKWLIHFVQSHTFNGFGWYRIALGAALLVFAL